VRIELLATPDCPHVEREAEIVRATLRDNGHEPRLNVIWVNDLDDAAGLGFHGSPTLRIDGRDVSPPPVDVPINLGCRLYPQPDGQLAGVIPAETILAEVERRREEAQHARAARPRLREIPTRLMRAFFIWASHRSLLAVLARLSLPLTRPLVHRFIAGNSLDDAMAVLEGLRERGLRWTVDVLGESVASREMAEAAADRYIGTLDALAERGLEANVSLKLTQMGLDIDAGFCQRNVARVVAKARQVGAFVRVDMEDHTKTDATLEIARALHADYPDVGVVIQAYLRRSADDVERLNAEAIRVRLCKGAYDEPAGVAFAHKAEVDASFARLAERLLAAGRYPAIATHDERLIGHVVDFARREGIGPERFEFQMLNGIRRDLQDWLVGEGYTVRVYVPYGAQWFPYFMRRLAERPANLLFLLFAIRDVLLRRSGS
jgi:proline dehydrogenase